MNRLLRLVLVSKDLYKFKVTLYFMILNDEREEKN